MPRVVNIRPRHSETILRQNKGVLEGVGDSSAIAKQLFRVLTWHSDDTTRHNGHLSPQTGFIRFGTMKTRKEQEKPQNYAT